MALRPRFGALDESFHEHPPASVEELARRAGVSVKTLYLWRKKGLKLMSGGVYSVSNVREWKRRHGRTPW